MKSNLVMCVFYLEDFKASPIPMQRLEFFDQQAHTVRRAGLKMIVRFAYAKSAADAEPLWVRKHLNQLAPHLRANADVIAVVESGFVGAHGEGWSTQHYGNEGDIDLVDWENRNAIVRKLLRILPADRKVLVRTREMKSQLFGTALTTAADVPADRAGRLPQ